MAGFGTVVTGTLIDGELRLGQELEVQPGGLRTRVRGLQSHKKKVEVVPAGTRTAVNLSGLAVEQLFRGQVLAAPATLRPTRAVDARLRLIKDARLLGHNADVAFHTGAAETLGRVKLLDRAELRSGEEAWVQVSLHDQVALAKGDLFIVRQPSPSMTLGGGTIVEPHARRHRRHQPAVLEQLAVLAQGTPEEVILQQLRVHEPADVDELMRRAGLPADDARAAIHRLLESRALLALDAARNGATRVEGRTFVISADGWQALANRVESVLGAHHQSYPLRRGLPKEELRTRLGAEARLFARMLHQLEAQGLVAEDGPFVRLSSHVVRLTPEQERQVARLLEVLREAGVAPPDRAEWEAALRISPELTDALVAQGTLVEVAPDLVYDRQTLDALVDRIRVAIRHEGPLTVARIRDLLGASRKFVLALVGYTDEHKITRRVGDERILY
jgi:selenocysteine-specific elongation factor